MVWDIYVRLLLCGVQAVGDIGEDAVVSPGVFPLVQGHLAVIQDMACCFLPPAQLAMVTSTFPPLKKIISCGQCVGD